VAGSTAVQDKTAWLDPDFIALSKSGAEGTVAPQPDGCPEPPFEGPPPTDGGGVASGVGPGEGLGDGDGLGHGGQQGTFGKGGRFGRGGKFGRGGNNHDKRQSLLEPVLGVGPLSPSARAMTPVKKKSVRKTAVTLINRESLIILF